MEGLLGDFDDRTESDLRSRSGASFEDPLGFEELYGHRGRPLR